MDDAVGTRLSGRQRKARVVAFWSLTLLGAPIMCGAWIWLTVASTEQVTESAKAPPGDTSTDGLFVMFGVVPLVLVHLLGLVILRSIAPRERDERGASWAIAAVGFSSRLVSALPWRCSSPVGSSSPPMTAATRHRGP